MIQVQTEMLVADNTGAKRIECIKVLGGSKRRYASIGDTIVVAVKEAIPKGKVKKGSVHKAVVVRVKYGIHRDDGSKVRFDNNAAVLVDDKGEPVGTRVGAYVISSHTVAPSTHAQAPSVKRSLSEKREQVLKLSRLGNISSKSASS